MTDAAKDQMLVELEKDIQEFRDILANNATRSNVKKVLEGWIEKCEMEKKSMEKILES